MDEHIETTTRLHPAFGFGSDALRWLPAQTSSSRALFSPAAGAGWSDFLEKVERPFSLREFSYEVTDTKLKRRPDPKHVLQMVLYSDLLAEVQEVMPEWTHLALGDGSRVSLRLADYSHYARAARKRLEDFVAAPEPTRPIPCSDCALCRWADHCESVWADDESLFNVANITRGQVKKLESAGIRTLAELVGTPPAGSQDWVDPFQ